MKVAKTCLPFTARGEVFRLWALVERIEHRYAILNIGTQVLYAPVEALPEQASEGGYLKLQFDLPLEQTQEKNWQQRQKTMTSMLMEKLQKKHA